MYKIGVIGAGKVGVNITKYFNQKNNYYIFSGFYSKTLDNAIYAKNFTDTKLYNSIYDLVLENDIVIITTTDDEIKNVWNEIKKFNIKNKIFVHCSGSLSSNIFCEADKLKSYKLSFHPLVAVNDKENSYKSFNNVFFTLEGDNEAVKIFSKILEMNKNNYKILNKNDKTIYHLSAVIFSNLVIGLGNISINLLKKYGFSEKEARLALENLAKNNLDNFFNSGTYKALTGPVERADLNTITRHIDSIKDNENIKNIYTNLSIELLNIAKEKNSNRNYEELENLLKKQGV